MTWRLALAYATHGAPLPYTYTNPDEVRDRLVYFRAVDTSALPPLRGSGGEADKVLLSFVNFSREPQTLGVRVTMPREGVYAGTRFGPEEQYLAARSRVQVAASPAADLVETLGPGEAVQYILTRDPDLTEPASIPEAPTDLRAEPGKIGKIGYVRLAWPGGPADEVKIQRSADGERFLQIDAIPGTETSYEDASRTGPEQGMAYWYRVKAASASGESGFSKVVRVEIPR